MYMCVGVCDSGTDGELHIAIIGVCTCTRVSLLQMHACMYNDMAPATKYHCSSAREV